MTHPIVYCLQHSERVRPLTVVEWSEHRNVDLRIVRVDLEPLPEPTDIDRLVVLGGQMNTDQAAAHPWLADERTLLARLVAAGRARIFGICLGSQLLVEVLGGSVGRAAVPEIGWQRVRLTDAGRRSFLYAALPDTFDAFEWHGDAWQLPDDEVVQLALTSDGCTTQGFTAGPRVNGVQFHPEFTWERTRELAATTTDDLTPRGCIQPARSFLAQPERFDRLRELCFGLLDRALLDPIPE